MAGTGGRGVCHTRQSRFLEGTGGGARAQDWCCGDRKVPRLRTRAIHAQKRQFHSMESHSQLTQGTQSLRVPQAFYPKPTGDAKKPQVQLRMTFVSSADI